MASIERVLKENNTYLTQRKYVSKPKIKVFQTKDPREFRETLACLCITETLKEARVRHT